ncbi:MAG: hypothetical protein ACK6AO_04265 [Planctomycetota bacterium]
MPIDIMPAAQRVDKNPQLRQGHGPRNPNREGGSGSTRLMASRDDYSSASSFTLRVTGKWPLATYVGRIATMQ